MKRGKVLSVELSTQTLDGQQLYYATLDLPAQMHEMRDACQRARFWDYTINPKSITVLECSYPPDLDTFELADTATIEELNLFAGRVANFTDKERVALKAVFQKLSMQGRFSDGIMAKDLINMTYGLSEMIVVEGIRNDRDLGEFVIHNDMDPAVTNVPDESLHLLDKAQIGQTQRESDQGMYIDNCYVVTADYALPTVYDGRFLHNAELPEPWFAFKLKVAEAPIAQPGDTEHAAEWIRLPMEREDAQAVAKRHNEERIEECVCYGFQSSIPQISELQFFNMREFEILNRLAWQMSHMPVEEQCKFKAALELEQPTTMTELADVADNLYKYDFTNSLNDAGSYFRRVLAICLHRQFDKSWIRDLSCESEGAEMLRSIGGKVTPYGVISGRDQPLYQMIPRQEEPETMDQDESEDLDEEHTSEMGGMAL